MPLPTTTVRTVDAPPVQPTPVGSKRAFIVAEAVRGPLGPQRFGNLADLKRKNAERTGVGIAGYDAIEVALREGCPEVYFTRAVGPAAAAATLNLDGPAAGTPFSLTLTIAEVGEWANGSGTGTSAIGLAAEVTSPGGGNNRQINIYRNGATTPWLSSPVFTTRDGALAWNTIQTLVTVGLGGENALPVVAALANFTGGSSDSAGITPTQVKAALDRCPKWLGDGQVVAPGRNTVATNTALLQHCQDFDRTAYLEIADGLLASDIATATLTLRALGLGAEGLPRLGGAWSQFAICPGIAPGSTRTVPWTVVMLGLTARLESSEGHANVQPAGDFGVPRYVSGVTRYFSDADAQTIFDAGCNVVTNYQNYPRNRSFRSLEADGTSEWVDLAHTRLDRYIRSVAFDVGRNMGARLINRTTIQEFGARLRLRLEPLWKLGATFGDTPSQAARVDVDSVNDITSIRAREVNAAIGVRMSEHAEQVNITIAKVPVGQEV